VWGLAPTFRAGAGLQRVGLSLLSGKADLVRAHLANALRDPAQLVTAAGTVALTVSASLLVTLSAPRTHERPERVPFPAPALERAVEHPVVAASRTTQIPAHGSSRNEGEPGDRHGPKRGQSSDHGRHYHPPSDASRPPGVAYGWDYRPPKHADNGTTRGGIATPFPRIFPPGRTRASVTVDDRVLRAFGIAPLGPRKGRTTLTSPADPILRRTRVSRSWLAGAHRLRARPISGPTSSAPSRADTPIERIWRRG
jgi:hypothetical protein